MHRRTSPLRVIASARAFTTAAFPRRIDPCNSHLVPRPGRVAHAWNQPLRRGIKTLDFGGVRETVHERADYPIEQIRSIFKDDTIAVLGYGTQGRGQGLNLRDQGLPVILGLRRQGRSWALAVQDGWLEGKNLFDIESACNMGTVVMYMLSDAAQAEMWPAIKPYLTRGKTLCFAHGFALVYSSQTRVVPPADVDVVMVAPKGSGVTVRNSFLDGTYINAAYAVEQDVSGAAHDRARALSFAVGARYLYPTTFKKEVVSDLAGERGTLVGAIHGLFQAQYEVLRAHGHTPSEAFNETVEEATQSLYPLIGEHGMDWMIANCSTTAQRGALDWAPEIRNAVKPVLERIYESVESGEETRRSLTENSRPDYHERLEVELAEIRDSEMWRAGKTVRSLRPLRPGKKVE